MVIVDTSVWVDFFVGKSDPRVRILESLFAGGEDIALCGVILAEVLQGIRDDRQYRRTRRYFDDLVFLPMTRDTFVRAAEIYRFLRRRGVTIRKPVDCMIASVAIAHNAPLLHNDRDFDPNEEHCGLRVVRPDAGGKVSAR